MSKFDQQMEKIRTARGFIAALDQSGGSTPKALRLYGIEEDAYEGDEEMFRLVHEMRTRIITSPSFNGDRILGAILFENTLDREIGGKSSAAYLWEEKNVVPFLKVDKGLADVVDGAQVMKPMPDLDALPDISRPFATAVEGEEFLPFKRDPDTLARPWAIPGTPGLEHRIGGLEKHDLTGNVAEWVLDRFEKRYPASCEPSCVDPKVDGEGGSEPRQRGRIEPPPTVPIRE